MSKKTRKSFPEQNQPPAAAPRQAMDWPLWKILLTAFGALLIAFEIYGPALQGPFVLDDLYMPFGRPDAAEWAARGPWVGNRPLLQFTFWINYLLAGVNTFSYHAGNVLMHYVVAVIVLLILRRLLGWQGETGVRRDVLAGFGAALLLVHPIHTEAVAYVTSRSDVQSTLFAYGALAVYLLRRDRDEPADGVTIGSVLALLLFAVLSKEQAAAFPAALLLTDYFFRPGFSLAGIRANWRLYGLLAAGGAAAAAFVARVLLSAETAGFGTGVKWYDYLATQGKVIWIYLRMTVLPFGQNVDPEYVLASPSDPVALAGLVALAAITVGAWAVRKRYPLGAAGWLLFVVLIAPTSSVVPIADLIAERRMYFPFLGVALIAVEVARRAKFSRAPGVGAMVAVVVLFAWLTYGRSAVWGSELALWTDAVAKSPKKMRPRFQFAHALYQQQQCPEAAAQYAEAAKLAKPDAQLLVDWALALDCAGRAEDAAVRLNDALKVEKSAHTYATLGMIHGKANRSADALQALAEAERLDPRFAMTYAYRGNVYAAQGNWAGARDEFKKALAIEPSNQAAQQGFAAAQQALGGR